MSDKNKINLVCSIDIIVFLWGTAIFTFLLNWDFRIVVLYGVYFFTTLALLRYFRYGKNIKWRCD